VPPLGWAARRPAVHSEEGARAVCFQQLSGGQTREAAGKTNERPG
jgi:hypothetical protein